MTASAFGGRFEFGTYLNSLLVLTSFLAILALGQGSVILSGGLDLSVPWTITLAGVVLTGLTLGSNQAAFWAVPLVIGIGVLIGLVNGAIVVVLGVSPIVVTLAMNGVLQGAALIFSNGSPIGFAPPIFRWMMTGTLVGVTPILWFLAAFVAFATLLLSRTTFGRRLYAVGSNQTSARYPGIPVGLTVITAYVVSSVCCCLVGIMLSGFSGQAFNGMGDSSPSFYRGRSGRRHTDWGRPRTLPRHVGRRPVVDSDRDAAVGVIASGCGPSNHLRKYYSCLGRTLERTADFLMRSGRQKVSKETTMAPATRGRIGELFEPIDHSTMHERVYDRIRDAFASGMVVPGQRIVIREFARSFGTSMMPIRDALRRLEAENAVVATTGRNLAIPIMTANDYDELCLIRVSLEGLAASEAAKNMNEAQIEEASKYADLMENASDSRDIEGTMHFNRKFHFSVYAGANRPLLLRMIESLWLRVGPQLAFAIRHDIHGGEVVRSPYHPHRQALAALRARDFGSASLAIAYDISRAGRNIIEHLRATKNVTLPAGQKPRKAKRKIDRK